MRPMHKTRSLRFVLAAVLLSLAAALAAQTPQWKPYGSSSQGFRVQFPSEPEVSKNSIPVSGSTFELRSYVAEVGSTALYVGVCDYGAKGVAEDPEVLLDGAKKGAVEHENAHILSEKKIALNANHGVEFEAENDKLHFTVRMYKVGGMLYQTMVISPLNAQYADTVRFLDSFQLVPPHADH